MYYYEKLASGGLVYVKFCSALSNKFALIFIALKSSFGLAFVNKMLRKVIV